jgi:hypothetical protein
MDLPVAGYMNHPSRTEGEMGTAFENIVQAVREMPGAGGFDIKTLSNNTFTPTLCANMLDTEGGAAADYLDRVDISGVKNGHELKLWGYHAARPITVRNLQGGVGEILLSAGREFILTPDRCLVLVRNGNRWREANRSADVTEAGASHGSQVFTSSGTFTVPEGVDRVWVSLTGGGGGGGGGSGNWAYSGSAGQAGGASSFGAHASSPGGGGGGGSSGVTLWTDHWWLAGGAPGTPYGRHGRFSIDGNAGYGGEIAPSPFGQYGRGGKGGNGGAAQAGYESGARAGGGGGSGSSSASPVFKQLVTGLTPGGTVAVTVGAGGAGGAGGSCLPVGSPDAEDGQAGSAGIVIVEW